MTGDNKSASVNRLSTLEHICEALIFASTKPLGVDKLKTLIAGEPFESEYLGLTNTEIKSALASLASRYVGRGVVLVEVAGGFRFQTASELATVVNRLWDERPQKYSRALLETLALVAYRQPITRGDIEEIRGVSVSSHIIKTLVERDWVRIVGHRDVPGRPAIYATTKLFLDHFNLKGLSELPALADIRDLESIGRDVAQQLELVDDKSVEQAGL